MSKTGFTLYHQHVPKSGGTSLNKFLRRNLKSSRWISKKEHPFELRNIPGLYKIDKNILNQYDCFHGHWGNLFFNQFSIKIR